MSIQTPTADPQSLSTREDTPLDIILTDSDPDWDPLTFTVVSTPTHGILSGTAPYVISTPEPGYAVLDRCSFIANDGELDSVVAEVSITIKNSLYVPVIFR